jgi:putative peptide zinc metalloprotease protein
MNLTRVLNVALPEIPVRSLAQSCPRVDPGAVYKEHIENGEAVVRVYVPSARGMYTFPSQNWALIRLFDGKRSYGEIAEVYSAETGFNYGEEQVREFADSLEGTDFWYRTTQEKNVLLMQKSADERRRLLKPKSKYGDLSEVLFPAINPDKFLTWLDHYTGFIYTWWFTLITLAGFAFAAGITFTHWSEIGRDTLEFYNFTNKTWMDVFQYYVLVLVTVVIHETAHGHACKHYGGRVPTMGFALVYLLPAFYTDTTEGDVHGSRSQRIVIAVAGVWSELMLYSILTPIWWATPPDTAVHNAAYVTMLSAGIATVLLNWNPLMKLDGYYILSEFLGYIDLKENSTAYVSAWVKRHLWRLPVEVPYVPRQRRLGYVIYALLSGAYSYTVLYILARFAGNVFRNFNPEWSFVPEFAVAALIFKSRIRNLVNFMKLLYLDKKDRIYAWLKTRQALSAALVGLVFLLLPLKHETAKGRFVLQPAERAVMRTLVPGTVTEVYAWEGQQVLPGSPLARLRNLPLESKLARSEADYAIASRRATAAAIRYVDMGSANAERDQLAQRTRQLSAEFGGLELNSPIAGTVVTPRVADRLGSYVDAGTELLEIDDLNRMRARIYVPEQDIFKIGVGAAARLNVDGIMDTVAARVAAIAPASSEIDPGLADVSKYKGLRPPNFYVVDLLVENPDMQLKPGSIGTARIYGQRRSLAGFALRGAAHMFARKLW